MAIVSNVEYIYAIQQILMIPSSLKENLIYYLLIQTIYNTIILAKLAECWPSTN